MSRFDRSPLLFSCMDGSDKLKKLATVVVTFFVSCLQVALIVPMSCLPFVWHFVFTATHTHTHMCTCTHIRTKRKMCTHVRPCARTYTRARERTRLNKHRHNAKLKQSIKKIEVSFQSVCCMAMSLQPKQQIREKHNILLILIIWA